MLSMKEYYSSKFVSYADIVRFTTELGFNLESKKIESYEKRMISLDEAKRNTCGLSIEEKELYAERKLYPNDYKKWTPIFSSFYQKGDLSIGSFKPGKEAASDYTMTSYYPDKRKVPNPHDMFPVMLREKRNIAVKITYKKNQEDIRYYTPWTLPHISDIFDFILLKPQGSLALELIGCLIVRMAFMVDHLEDEFGNMRVIFPHETVKMIREIMPDIECRQGEVHRKNGRSKPSQLTLAAMETLASPFSDP